MCEKPRRPGNQLVPGQTLGKRERAGAGAPANQRVRRGHTAQAPAPVLVHRQTTERDPSLTSKPGPAEGLIEL